jgi:hypothetical protein
MTIRPVGTELFHLDGQTDRQTDMTKLTVALRNVPNALKNKTHSICKSEHTCKRTDIAYYFRDRNHSVKFQLGTMRVFQYDKH